MQVGQKGNRCSLGARWYGLTPRGEAHLVPLMQGRSSSASGEPLADCGGLQFGGESAGDGGLQIGGWSAENFDDGDQQSCLELVSSRASYAEIGHRSRYPFARHLIEVVSLIIGLVYSGFKCTRAYWSSD